MGDVTAALMRELDERGVDYTFDHDLYVEWYDKNRRQVTAFESSGDHGTVMLHAHVLPHDAVAVTLGDTCEVVQQNSYVDDGGVRRMFVELSCHTLDAWEADEAPAFCPFCGKRVLKVGGDGGRA